VWRFDAGVSITTARTNQFSSTRAALLHNRDHGGGAI
jgi:hypothetical protein